MDNSSERIPPNDPSARYNNVGDDIDGDNDVANVHENDVGNDNEHAAENTGIMPSPSHKPVTPSLSSKIITKSPECSILICDMKIYENRLKSFKNWPSKCITPEKLARAGFYYTGIRDKVMCLYCANEFEYWGKDDDPSTEHKLASPHCQYFKKKPDHKSHIISSFVPSILRSVGIVTDTNMKVPSNYKALTSLESRKKTFETFPKKLTRDVNTFCKAGLFYIGENDRMVCFCCNQGLMDWEVDDDPWVEHARWSPLCSYVLLSKGKRFVEEVGGEVNYSLRINLEELIKLFTIHRQLEIDSDTASDLKTLIKNNIFLDYMEPVTFLRGSEEDLCPPDSVLCKICFKEKLEVLFMPCGHVIACIQCAVTLDVCAVCRQPFTMTLRVGLYITNIKGFGLQYCPSRCSIEITDPVLCKVCCKEEMQAVFLPCRHILTCFKCAPKLDECVVCVQPIYAYMQVFL